LSWLEEPSNRDELLGHGGRAGMNGCAGNYL